jgi:hypothetical protein
VPGGIERWPASWETRWCRPCWEAPRISAEMNEENVIYPTFQVQYFTED